MATSRLVHRAAAMLALAATGASLPARIAAPAPAPASGHERVLPLEGGQNFRDLGGYRTTDGRTVRWGLLYRSGSMHFLTPADYAYLEHLGIRTVCDFRSTSERAGEPVTWPAGNPPRVLADDYVMNTGGLGKSAPGPLPTAAQARATMTASYPVLLARFNGQYRRMFGALLADQVPLAFNCTAGKDRTGIAAALLLTALGVPRDTVVADYLLTNRYFDPRKIVAQDDQASVAWRKLPPDVLHAYMAADPAYIAAMFQVLDRHRGGVAGYLHDELGLGTSDVAKLRQLYTRRSA